MEVKPFDKYQGNVPTNRGVANATPKPTDHCRICSGLGHWGHNCPHKLQIAAIVEEEDGHDGEHHDHEVEHEQPQDDQHENTEVDHADDEAEPLEGSQYSSAGEEYNARFYDEYEGDYQEGEERVFSINQVEEDNKELSQEYTRMTRIASTEETQDKTIQSRTTTYKLRKSSRPKVRPKKVKSESWPIVIKVNINGLDAITLLDTGSTADAISPEFARVANIKVFELEKPISIQLGCKGSRSKINFGTEATLQYSSINQPHYWDVVNLDRYDAIIGIRAMRKYGITIDPKSDRVTVLGQTSPTLSEGEEETEMERRNAYRRAKSAGH